MKSASILLVILLIAAFVIAGCGTSTSTPTISSTSSPTSAAVTKSAPSTSATPASVESSSLTKPEYGGILTIINPGTVGTLGTPAEAVAGTPNITLPPALEFLTTYDKDLRMLPKLVQSAETDPNGKFITLHLTKGIKFQDGTDFDAAAVKYNLSNYAPGGAVPQALKDISSYEVIDPYTLRLNLERYNSTLLYELGSSRFGMIASPTAMQKATTPENMAKDHVVGTGPFKLVSYERGRSITYTKNNSYWNKDRPYLDGIQWLDVADPVSALMAFRKGDAQVIAKLTPKDAQDLKKDGFVIDLSDSQPNYYVVPDGANPDSPWAKPKVREAAEYAIDRKTLAESQGLGLYTPLTQYATPKDPVYVPSLSERAYNPAKAKQLLAEAGYPNGFETTFYAPTSIDKDLLTILQNYFQAVGIKVTIDIGDSARITALKNNGWKNGLLFPTPPGNNALMPSIVSLVFDTNPTGSVLWLKSVRRPAGWQDKISAGFTAMDPKKYTAAMQDIVKTIYDEAMVIPLYANPSIAAHSKKVNDLRWSLGGHPFFYDIQNAWLSK